MHKYIFFLECIKAMDTIPDSLKCGNKEDILKSHGDPDLDQSVTGLPCLQINKKEYIITAVRKCSYLVKVY